LRTAPAFASTVNVTTPLPVPELETWIQASPVVAVQLHQDPAVTPKLPEVPEADSVPLEDGLVE
jgi:hypothetical protein